MSYVVQMAGACTLATMLSLLVRRSFAAAATKKTTGLVGLDVNPAARDELLALYTQTLEQVKTIPEHAEYRKAVEKVTQHRLSVVQGETDVVAIESKINCGQIEELVKQAHDELALIPQMAKWKPWEPLAVVPPMGQWEPAS